jgi:hypothetical protein
LAPHTIFQRLTAGLFPFRPAMTETPLSRDQRERFAISPKDNALAAMINLMN